MSAVVEEKSRSPESRSGADEVAESRSRVVEASMWRC